MSNGHVCCILGVCCPPRPDGSPDPKQEAALAAKLHEWARSGGSPGAAKALLASFDLAPKGTTGAILAGWAAPPIARAAVVGEKIVDLYAGPMAERADGGR
jgi:hypothetical protein